MKATWQRQNIKISNIEVIITIYDFKTNFLIWNLSDAGFLQNMT